MILAKQIQYSINAIVTTKRPIYFFENFLLTVSSNLLNYTPIKSGTIFKYVYLKKKYAINYKNNLKIDIARVLMSFISNCIVFLILFSVYFTLKNTLLDTTFWIILSFLILSILYVIYIMTKKKINIFVKSKFNLFSYLMANKKLKKNCLSIFTLTVIQILVLSLQYKLLFYIFNISPPLNILLLFSSLMYFVSILTVIPGNLVIRETVIAFFLTLYNLDFNVGFTIGLIERGLLTFTIVIFGLMSILILRFRKT